MSSVTRHFDFCAAHRLAGHPGKCRRLHGHNYIVSVTVLGAVDAVSGMVTDFGDLKSSIGQWIDDNLDHRVILQGSDIYASALRNVVNEQEAEVFLMDVPPTAENLALLIRALAEKHFQYQVGMVRVQETPNCSAVAY